MRSLFILPLLLLSTASMAQDAAPTVPQAAGQALRDAHQQNAQELRDMHQQNVGARQQHHLEMSQQLEKLKATCATGDQAACQQVRRETQALRQGNQEKMRQNRDALRQKAQDSKNNFEKQRLERRQQRRANAAAAGALVAPIAPVQQ